MLLDLVLFFLKLSCATLFPETKKRILSGCNKVQSIDAVDSQTKYDLTVELTTKLCVISYIKFCNIVRFHLWVFV